MRREFLVVGQSRLSAHRKCLTAIKRYADGRPYHYVQTPETLRYDGRSKKLNGKWRAYARIEVTQ